MQHFDVTLKTLLNRASDTFFRQVAGAPVERWLNIETPQVQNLRLDLLGIRSDGRLLHIELQSINDPNMALRMVEYFIRILRLHKGYPKQIVLYVGEAPLNMPSTLISDSISFSYTLLDARQLDTEALLASSQIEDNLLAILTSLHDPTGTIREILKRIAALPQPDRGDVLAQFLLISGLRSLRPLVEEEARNMSIAEIDAQLKEEWIGPIARKAKEEGRQEGIQEGRKEGLAYVVTRLLENRSGTVSHSLKQRIASLSDRELDHLFSCLLGGASAADLFPET